MSRREQREAQKLVETRVSEINRALRATCMGGIEARPTGVLRWQIVPAWGRTALPIRSDGLMLVFHEEIVALSTDLGIHLICEKFEYKVEATKDLTAHQSRVIIAGW